MKRVKTIVADDGNYKLEVKINLNRKDAYEDDFLNQWNKMFNHLGEAVQMDFNLQDIKIK